MRKDNGNRAFGKLIKSTYRIKGLNLDRFINTVRRQKIALYDVKKTSAKCMLVSVNLSDGEKFFAIGKDLCYNIKKVRDKGALYPIFFLVKKFGLVLGAVVFIATAVFFNDIIFHFSFSGSGKVYSREVKEYLNSVGVKEFSRFSSVDLNSLGDRILENNSHLSFASCVKNGNRLEIELIMSTEKVKTLDGNVYELKSDVDGVVEDVKVYRGTAEVKKGDNVKKRELLVGGYAVIKEQTVKINLLATVTIIYEQKFIYVSEKDNEEQVAKMFAQGQTDKEIVATKTTKSFDGKKFVYDTTLSIRRVIFAG